MANCDPLRLSGFFPGVSLPSGAPRLSGLGEVGATGDESISSMSVHVRNARIEQVIYAHRQQLQIMREVAVIVPALS